MHHRCAEIENKNYSMLLWHFLGGKGQNSLDLKFFLFQIKYTPFRD
jgi:hypothetical protein